MLNTFECLFNDCLTVSGSSAVGFAAVSDAGDLDGVVSGVIEEDPVIAAAEPEVGSRRLELFHVAGAVGEIPVYAVENLHGGFPVNGAHIGAGFR